MHTCKTCRTVSPGKSCENPACGGNSGNYYCAGCRTYSPGDRCQNPGCVTTTWPRPELKRARKLLEAHLEAGGEGVLQEERWKDTKRLILIWWAAFKAWERTDSFYEAFTDNRMVMRTWDSALDKHHVLSIPDNRITGGTAEDFLRNGYVFEVGLKSLALRMDPSNFYPESKKYALGIHDMSSTLLDCSREISSQAHKKSNGTIFSFTPLSDPKDQVVFERLSQLSKRAEACTEFRELIREIRSKMTRAKLAAEHDMATGFTARKTPTGYKLKYGLGATTSVVNEEETAKKRGGLSMFPGTLTSRVPVTPEVVAERRATALNFRTIVARKLFAKNEITVAIREHAGPFPIFAKYENKEFLVFEIKDGTFNFTGVKIGEDGRFK
jgi:hypothetical protein